MLPANAEVRLFHRAAARVRAVDAVSKTAPVVAASNVRAPPIADSSVDRDREQVGTSPCVATCISSAFANSIVERVANMEKMVSQVLDAVSSSKASNPIACSGNAGEVEVAMDNFGPYGEEAPSTPMGAPPREVARQNAVEAAAIPGESSGTLSDLLVGDLSLDTWQYKPYKADNATWLAAAQRRHMHRRRANLVTSVASVDLSGPHEPTLMPGKRLGQQTARYFLVLSIRSDMGPEQKVAATQTDGDLAQAPVDAANVERPVQLAPVQPDVEDRRGPLIYCEVLPRKSDAEAAVKRILARVRDDLGRLPASMPHRLHSDQGGEFLSTSLQSYCDQHGIRRTTTAGYDPSGNGAGESAVGFVKRKARQLLTGSGLLSNWWGVASLAAASYSRCAAGLAEWP